MPESDGIRDDLEIQDLFRVLKLKKECLWTWQEEKWGKIVHFSCVKKVDPIKRVIQLTAHNTKGYSFNPDLAVSIYSELKQFALQSPIVELNRNQLWIPIPELITQPPETFFEELSLIEKEQINFDEFTREHKRGKCKEGTFVLFRRLRYSDDGLCRMEMFDFSKGGLSFVVDDPAEFVIGEDIEICKIGGKTPKRLLLGVVRSIREIGKNQFKVGVQFTNS